MVGSFVWDIIYGATRDSSRSKKGRNQPIDWPLVGTFTGVAAVGALAGTRLNRHVSQVRIKQGFALLILILGGYSY